MARADYFDGLTAELRPVDAALDGEYLTLRSDGGRLVGRWLLADLRRVPGSSRDGDEMRIMKEAGDDARLTIRDSSLIQRIEQVTPLLNRRPHEPGALRKAILTWGMVAVGAIAAIVFVGAPLLADQLAVMIPPERERQLGESIADEIVASGIPALEIPPGVCNDPHGVEALTRMTRRLENAAGAHLPLTVRVMDSPVVNAFALPGGQIFLMRGLIENATSPEEVAGVLAHEIGHVVNRDPTRNALRGAASGVVISYVLGDVVGGFAGAAIVSAVIDARYSRDAEAGADETALAILETAEVSVEPFANFFQRLREAYGDGGSFLDSHPQSSAREAMVRAAVARGRGAAAGAPILEEADWLAMRQICS